MKKLLLPIQAPPTAHQRDELRRRADESAGHTRRQLRAAWQPHTSGSGREHTFLEKDERYEKMTGL